MVGRAFLVWVALCLLAIANGTVRQYLLVPSVGAYGGHLISSASLSLLILLVAWWTVPWIGPATLRDAWAIGVLWLATTVVFEFVAGHFLFHHPWSKLLADYDVRQGRVWVVVLVATAVAPRWAAGIRGMVR